MVVGPPAASERGKDGVYLWYKRELLVLREPVHVGVRSGPFGSVQCWLFFWPAVLQCGRPGGPNDDGSFF